MKKIICVLLAAFMLLSVAGCSGSRPGTDATGADGTGSAESTEKPAENTVTFSVSKDEKFGAAFLDVGQESFESNGFSLGDSFSIVFSNGFALSDVPYFNGYYVRNGNPVIVAYPGDTFVRITFNNKGIWDEAELSEGDSVDITLSEEGKYSAVQEALGQVYSFERDDYPDDVSFVNFRALSGGNLKENFIFRGASPVDNSRGRAAYTDALLRENSIGFVIDLADSEEDILEDFASDGFSSEYIRELYGNGSVIPLDMSSSYASDAYREKVAGGLRRALSAEGPFYIHCLEGKDRTGFVCLLLEALAGADFEELKADYMKTYENYFRISEEKTPEKYSAVVDLYFVPFLEFLHGTDDLGELKTASFSADAAAYLTDGGMTGEEIQGLISLISE